MNVVLVGYRGSGKTTVGRRLADQLWYKFVDIDDLIVEKAGKNIRRIFEEDGEGPFRDIEAQCLADLLKREDHVIGLGGGTVEREDNQTLLKKAGCRIIYLRCEPEVLHQRVLADPRSAETRPSLTPLGGGLDEIKLKVSQREPLYRKVMDAELDVTSLTPEEAVVYIARLL